MHGLRPKKSLPEACLDIRQRSNRSMCSSFALEINYLCSCVASTSGCLGRFWDLQNLPKARGSHIYGATVIPSSSIQRKYSMTGSSAGAMARETPADRGGTRAGRWLSMMGLSWSRTT